MTPSLRTLLLAGIALGLGAGAAAAHNGHPPAARPSEIGVYARDLPPSAAAPTADTLPDLRDDLGRLSWNIGAANPRAQAFFDQGYRLAWAFNHGEALRAFRAAQAADPGCAMCFWGEAWVLGPNINLPMDAAANTLAMRALDRARALAARQPGSLAAGLVEALAARHAADPDAARPALDTAYAEAMERVRGRFPASPEIALLTADALMNLSPWDYWADAGRTPKGETARLVALLEEVLTRHPEHPGAIHLYIHTVEASDRPERAAPHARRLAALMPGAGHLVHMPSHLWYRLGLWRESLELNRQAVAADEAALARGGASLVYGQGYYPHNVHFVMVSALMGGDGATAVEAAQKLASLVSERAAREVAWTQPIMAAPYVAHARFSTPEAVLALPAPVGDLPFVRAHWHNARGEALARLGRLDAARAEAAAIAELAASPGSTALNEIGLPAREVLTIAGGVVSARVAMAAGDLPRAIALLQEAADAQEALPYMEPPFWYYPVRQTLGAALLAQGRAEEAATAFRAVLATVPNNGWAAAGLLGAAERLGDTAGAAEARELLRRGWFGPAAPALDRL